MNDLGDEEIEWGASCFWPLEKVGDSVYLALALCLALHTCMLISSEDSL
jgi:hypothetical protein